MNGISLNKVERLSKTKGIKGWFSLVCLLAIMCFDQFVLEIPFMNIAFPILAVCAACMSPIKNIVLILAYSLIFELSCSLDAYGVAESPTVAFRGRYRVQYAVYLL